MRKSDSELKAVCSEVSDVFLRERLLPGDVILVISHLMMATVYAILDNTPSLKPILRDIGPTLTQEIEDILGGEND